MKIPLRFEGATRTISFPEAVFSSVSGIGLAVWLPGDLYLTGVPGYDQNLKFLQSIANRTLSPALPFCR